MCQRPAEWKSAESSASRSHSRAGAIAASSLRTSSESDTFELQQPALVPDTAGAVATDPVRGDHAVARDDEGKPVVRANRAGGALRVRVAGERRQLAVGDDLAPRNIAQRLDDCSLELGQPVELERDIRERVARACEALAHSVGEEVM